MVNTGKPEARKAHICLDGLGFIRIQDGKNFGKRIDPPARAGLLDLHRSCDGDGAQLVSDVVLRGEK